MMSATICSNSGLLTGFNANQWVMSHLTRSIFIYSPWGHHYVSNLFQIKVKLQTQISCVKIPKPICNTVVIHIHLCLFEVETPVMCFHTHFDHHHFPSIHPYKHPSVHLVHLLKSLPLLFASSAVER